MEKINIDLKQAMLKKDKLKLESLRAIKASLILNQTSVSSQNIISKEDGYGFSFHFIATIAISEWITLQ